MVLAGCKANSAFPSNNVVFWDLKDESKEVPLEYNKDVCCLRGTMNWVVVGTSEGIYVFGTDNIRNQQKIEIDGTPAHISIPESSRKFVVDGFKEVVLLYNEGKTWRVDHKSEVKHSTISPDGKYYAVAINDGTLIKIFEFDSGAEKASLIRGNTSVEIRSLTFSHDNSLIAISSNHGTVHIYSTGLGKCCKYSGNKLIGYSGYGYIKDTHRNPWVHFIKGTEYRLGVVDTNGDYTLYNVSIKDGGKIDIKKGQTSYFN